MGPLTAAKADAPTLLGSSSARTSASMVARLRGFHAESPLTLLLDHPVVARAPSGAVVLLSLGAVFAGHAPAARLNSWQERERLCAKASTRASGRNRMLHCPAN